MAWGLKLNAALTLGQDFRSRQRVATITGAYGGQEVGGDIVPIVRILWKIMAIEM